MIKKDSNRLILTAGAIVLVFLAGFIVSGMRDSASGKNSGESGQKPHTGLHVAERSHKVEASKSNRAKRKTERPMLTKASDPGIAPVIKRIKDLEFDRTRFCREIEDEERILHEFVIDYPSREEVQVIRDLIFQVDGYTMDPAGKLMSWQQRLLTQYLWSAEYKHCIVTTRFLKETGKGDYTIVGVHEGQLKLREGKAPVSADGSFNFLEAAQVHSWTRPWRFSHLLQLEDDEDGSAR